MLNPGMGYYLRTGMEKVIHIKNLISFHYFEYVKDFHGIGEQHDFWELVYVDYGKIRVMSNEDEYMVCAGEAFLHQPHEYHNVLATGDFASVIIISFDCYDAPLECLKKQVLRFYGKEMQIIGELFTEGSKLFRGPLDIFDQRKLVFNEKALFGSEQFVTSYLEMLLILLVRNHQARDEKGSCVQPEADKEQGLVNMLCSILSEHVYDRLSFTKISRECGFSKSYLSKVFKNSMGVGVIAYYNQIKIKEAKRLISEDKYTFTEIADMLNFSSVHYFSKYFKQITGMTPSGYQKSVKIKSVI